MIQHEHAVGLQRCAAEKDRHKKETHVGKYLKSGHARIFTDDAFRVAQQKDQEEAQSEALDKTHGTVIAAARAARAVWRSQQLEKRREERAARANKHRVSKAQTPPELTWQVIHAEGLSGPELRRIHDKLVASEASGKKERQTAALSALRELGDARATHIDIDLNSDSETSDDDPMIDCFE